MASMSLNQQLLEETFQEKKINTSSCNQFNRNTRSSMNQLSKNML